MSKCYIAFRKNQIARAWDNLKTNYEETYGDKEILNY